MSSNPCIYMDYCSGDCYRADWGAYGCMTTGQSPCVWAWAAT